MEYNELIARPALKKLFVALVSKLKNKKNSEGTFQFHTNKIPYKNIIGILKNLVNLDDAEKIPIQSLYWLKFNFEYILSCSTNPDEWKQFMKGMNIHHYLCTHTVIECITGARDFIKSLKHSNLQTARENKDEFVPPLQKNKKHLIEKKVISEMFNKYFPESKSVQDDFLDGFNNVLYCLNLSMVNFITNYGWDSGDLRSRAIDAFAKDLMNKNHGTPPFLNKNVVEIPKTIIKELILNIENEVMAKRCENLKFEIKHAQYDLITLLYNSFVSYLFAPIFLGHADKNDDEDGYNELFMRVIRRILSSSLFESINYSNEDYNVIVNTNLSKTSKDDALGIHSSFINSERRNFLKVLHRERIQMSSDEEEETDSEEEEIDFESENVQQNNLEIENSDENNENSEQNNPSKAEINLEKSSKENGIKKTENEESDFDEIEIDDEEVTDLLNMAKKPLKLELNISKKHPKRTYVRKRKIDEVSNNDQEQEEKIPTKRGRTKKNYPQEIVEYFNLKKLEKQSKCICPLCGQSKKIDFTYEIKRNVTIKACSDCLVLLKLGNNEKWIETIVSRLKLLKIRKNNPINGTGKVVEKYIKAPIAFVNNEFLYF